MSQDTMQLNEALAANYLLVDTTIRSWSGKKTDKDATTELLDQKGATRDGGAFVKKLLASADGELQKVHSAAAAARQYVYAHTLPWSTCSEGAKRGNRLLATVRAMPFLSGLKPFVDDHKLAVAELARVWDDRVRTAIGNLGQLADASDYPSATAIPALFHISVDMVPIPKITDFGRLNVPGELAEKLGERHAQMAEVAVQNAMENLRDRLVKELERFHTQLGKHAAGEKTRLHDTLVSNLQILVTLGKSMDLGSNQRYTELIARIESELLQRPVSAYRVSPERAREASEIARGLAVDAAMEEVWAG